MIDLLDDRREGGKRMLRDWVLIRVEMKSSLKDVIWVKSAKGKRMSLEAGYLK